MLLLLGRRFPSPIEAEISLNSMSGFAEPPLSIEAMKMETVLSADCDAVVKAVHVKPGDVVGAKDLLIALDR